MSLLVRFVARCAHTGIFWFLATLAQRIRRRFIVCIARGRAFFAFLPPARNETGGVPLLTVQRWRSA
jgi:hypothetical protein